jgi:hypothetical protein
MEEIRKGLELLGYEEDPELSRSYESEERKNLLFRYHGMGHYQVLGVNPKRRGDRRYFLTVLGGSNAYDVEANDRDFRNLSDYLTIEELSYKALRTVESSPY